MADPKLLPIQFLRECFSYDPETGEFHWKRRPAHHFSTEANAVSWNTQNAGARAFHNVSDGYCRAQVRFEGRRLRLTAGRVAFALVLGEAPEIVDHRDGDPSNNRWPNLRAATILTNRWNARKPKIGSNPLKGAYRAGSRWVARARLGRSSVKLGTYATAEEAHAAYCAFLEPRHGEFFNAGRVVSRN